MSMPEFEFNKDLGREFKFTAEDLALNAQGEMSRTQRRRHRWLRRWTGDIMLAREYGDGIHGVVSRAIPFVHLPGSGSIMLEKKQFNLLHNRDVSRYTFFTARTKLMFKRRIIAAADAGPRGTRPRTKDNGPPIPIFPFSLFGFWSIRALWHDVIRFVLILAGYWILVLGVAALGAYIARIMGW